MIILYFLVPLGLVLCALAVWAFFWAVNTGQFEELDSAATSPLEDDMEDDMEDGMKPDMKPDMRPDMRDGPASDARDRGAACGTTG